MITNCLPGTMYGTVPVICPDQTTNYMPGTTYGILPTKCLGPCNSTSNVVFQTRDVHVNWYMYNERTVAINQELRTSLPPHPHTHTHSPPLAPCCLSAMYTSLKSLKWKKYKCFCNAHNKYNSTTSDNKRASHCSSY